jgi:Pretoxin HINT domain/Pre-toxin TG
MDKRPVAKISSASEGPSLVRVAASVGVGFIPVLGSVQSVVELISGRDYITGEKTSRAWAAAGIVVGLVGLKGVLKAATKADDIVDGARRLASRTCCFVAGTLVATDRGVRPIEEIEVGDLVLSRDEYTGATAYKPVTNLIRRHDREIWDVILLVSQGGESTTEKFETTDDHPWRTSDGRWLKTLELTPGTEIQRSAGTPAGVISVTRTTRTARTFNLQVADFESNCNLDAVKVTGRAQRWWPRISTVAPDWATKGAHIHIDGIELAVRPAQNGQIVFRSVFSGQSAREVESAAGTAARALDDVGFRQRLYNAAARAIQIVDGGKAAELRFLMHALERMGL